MIPGPPFLFGACAVLFALLVAIFIPDHHRLADVKTCSARKSSSTSTAHAQNSSPLATPTSDTEDIEPLLQDSSMWLTAGPANHGAEAWALSASPAPLQNKRISAFFFFFLTSFRSRRLTKESSDVWRRSHWRALFTLIFTSCLFSYRMLRCVHVLLGRRHCLSEEVALQTSLCSRASGRNFCFLSLRAFKHDMKSKDNRSRCLCSRQWEAIPIHFKAHERTNSIFHRTHVWFACSCSGFVIQNLRW